MYNLKQNKNQSDLLNETKLTKKLKKKCLCEQLLLCPTNVPFVTQQIHESNEETSSVQYWRDVPT